MSPRDKSHCTRESARFAPSGLDTSRLELVLPLPPTGHPAARQLNRHKQRSAVRTEVPSFTHQTMTSPPAKRIKLESQDSMLPESLLASGNDPPLELTTAEDSTLQESEELEDVDGEHCSICLQSYADRTMIPTCSHEFCFECLLLWTGELNIKTPGYDSLMHVGYRRTVASVSAVFTECRQLSHAQYTIQVRLPKALSIASADVTAYPVNRLCT